MADALRHLDTLTQALKKVAVTGLIGGAGCGLIAILLGHSLGTYGAHPNNTPGLPELSGITAVAGFVSVALLTFSSLYLVVVWGLSRRRIWARYAAGGVFTLKVLLCLWLGRTSLGAMIIFALIASLDLYGLWVLLSNETGMLFSSPEPKLNQPKPANLVT